jgi:hypothetical protein
MTGRGEATFLSASSLRSVEAASGTGGYLTFVDRGRGFDGMNFFGKRQLWNLTPGSYLFEPGR